MRYTASSTAESPPPTTPNATSRKIGAAPSQIAHADIPRLQKSRSDGKFSRLAVAPITSHCFDNFDHIGHNVVQIMIDAMIMTRSNVTPIWGVSSICCTFYALKGGSGAMAGVLKSDIPQSDIRPSLHRNVTPCPPMIPYLLIHAEARTFPGPGKFYLRKCIETPPTFLHCVPPSQVCSSRIPSGIT